MRALGDPDVFLDTDLAVLRALRGLSSGAQFADLSARSGPWRSYALSYLELARRIGDVRAVRAAGLANGRNPIAVVIPCHRVIGANGSLVGYGGGLERKRKLLDLERGALF